MSLAIPLDLYAAGRLGEGAQSILSYSSRIIGMMLGIGSLAVSRAFLPVLSNSVSHGNHAPAHATTLRWAAILLVSGALMTIIVYFFSDWIVRIFLERGAFKREDSDQVIAAFQAGLLQVPPFLAGLVFLQLLASHRQYKAMALIAIINFAVKAVATIPLADHFGVQGIAYSNALMYVVALFTFFFVASFLRGRP
jgi:peptidoglycan biosynthesis protein MviN/MurJ (putative lipid II flippase)